MELVMWIVVGIVVGLGVIALAPVLIVGGWFIIINVILRLLDGTIWLLDQRWRAIRPGIKPAPSFGSGYASSREQAVPVLSALPRPTSYV